LRADLNVALLVIGEVLAGKDSVIALALVPHRNMRFDLALDQPAKRLSRPVGVFARPPSSKSILTCDEH